MVIEVPFLTTDVPYHGRSGSESLTVGWFWSTLSWKSSDLAKTFYTDWLLIISPRCKLVAKVNQQDTRRVKQTFSEEGRSGVFFGNECRIAGRIKKLSKRLDRYVAIAAMKRALHLTMIIM